MKVGIIGAGAIGMLISGYLGQKHQVHIYSERYKKRLNKSIEKISIKQENRTFSLEVNVYSQFEHMPDMDVIFICVKQTAIDDILPLLQSYQTLAKLIFIQNGMSHLEKIEKLSQNIYVGIVEHGAYKESDTKVVHAGRGQINLGQVNTYQENSQILKLLSIDDFPITFHENIMTLMKEKLIVNAVINPLTALFNVQNKAIVKNKYINQIAKEICREATEVLEMTFEENWQKVNKIATNTGENTSSMLQDIKSGKRTEVESILGYLLDQTKIKQPYINFAYLAILSKESEA